MVSQVKQKIFGAYLIVLILGIILAGLVYQKNEAVLTASENIVSHNLPNLHALFTIKDLTIQQKAIVYNLYASGDHEKFIIEYKRNREQIRSYIAQFKQHAIFKHYIATVEETMARLHILITQFDQQLTSNDDEHHIIELLTDITNVYQSIPSKIEDMINLEQANANQGGEKTETAITQVKHVVTGLGISIFVISLFVGYYMNNYIRDQAERRSLSMFPERNPNPVLRLNSAGKLEYANPMAVALLKKIDNKLDDPLTLLPETFLPQLQHYKIAHDFNTPIDYQVGTYILEANIHWLPDLNIFHIYISDVTDRKKAEEQLIHQAYHDALTGLPNRRQFLHDTQSHLLVSREKASKTAVILIWLDRFNLVTGSLGHNIGDNLLQTIASRLHNIVMMFTDPGVTINLYRFEGVVFSLLIPDYSKVSAPQNIAQHIVDSMGHPVYTDNREFFLSFSIGISVFPDDADDATTLLRNAESAMQFSKQQGGNNYHCYNTEMNAQAEDRLVLENNLRYALTKKELHLYYQPQICLSSNAIVGCEALIRWQHPTRGMIMPMDFIPLAEESGLITPIGEWILIEACEQSMHWSREGYPAIVVAVNISPRQFHHPGFFEQVRLALQVTGQDPNLLELEITESIAMQDTVKAIRIMHQLKSLGVRLSIDDFGTGFSSLSYLKDFPIDKLKIDQSFIRSLPDDTSNAAITQAIITLGRNLNLDIIAEGVETPQQLEFIQQRGCDTAQGYLFSRPLPKQEFDLLLQQHLQQHHQIDSKTDLA